ncbi:hypothetical protein BDZ45DRAFT_722988 [Acephala macrosclerotiorum]|nr:hypothetical protein BDZ45DRAFT_722988 [Acephala macrosclerotiorum]
MSKEMGLCRISTPTGFPGQAASSARPESEKEPCYRDIEMLIARDLDGKPEIRLNLKIEFAKEKHNSRNRPSNPIFQRTAALLQHFTPALIMLSLALVDEAFKDFHTINEIFDFEAPLNGDARILEWADPIRALPTASIIILDVSQQLASSILSSSPITPVPNSSQQNTAIVRPISFKAEVSSDIQRGIASTIDSSIEEDYDWEDEISANPRFPAKLIGHTEKDIFSSYYLDQSTAEEPTSSTEDDQLIPANKASPSPLEAVTRSSEDRVPKHSQMARRISIEAPLAKTIFRPSLATPSLPAPRSSVVRKPSTTHLSGASTLEIDRKIYEDIRNDCYECIKCHDLVGRGARLWRCETRRFVLHFFCAKWTYMLSSPWHCPGCNLPQDKEPEPKCLCEYEEELGSHPCN